MNRWLVADSAELERFRDFLMLLCRLQLGPPVHGRLDASDLVQQTLLDAEEELAAWLRRLLDEPTAWGSRP